MGRAGRGPGGGILERGPGLPAESPRLGGLGHAGPQKRPGGAAVPEPGVVAQGQAAPHGPVHRRPARRGGAPSGPGRHPEALELSPRRGLCGAAGPGRESVLRGAEVKAGWEYRF